MEQVKPYAVCILHKRPQTFRFMVGPGHCPIISKYGPSLSKAVGPVDPSFLVVEKSHFNKKYSSYSESTISTKQKQREGCQYSKTCLKQPLKKTKKTLITNGSLIKVKRIAECSPPLEAFCNTFTCIKQ